jgi:hypothetical protein
MTDPSCFIASLGYGLVLRRLPTLTLSISLGVKDVGRDSSVGIATCYGLEGLGIKSRWGRHFPHLPWDPPSLLYHGYQISLSGVKLPGRGANLSADVMERVELYLYSPAGSSWPFLGGTSPFFLTYLLHGAESFLRS